MPRTPPPLAELIASLRTAISADAQAARARRSPLEVLFLTLLAALLGRLEARAHAWHPTPRPALIHIPHSGAPHADAIAFHRFPDWILRGRPARGMRPAAPPPPPRPRTLPARAPPARALPPIRTANPTLGRGRTRTPAIHPHPKQTRRLTPRPRLPA